MAPGLKLRRGVRATGVIKGARRGRHRLPELILIPQDLRTADPSVFAELSAGTMGLAGATVQITGGSPFRTPPPNPEWQALLLGFGWLSDLRAANSPDAHALARHTVDDWLIASRPAESPDWALPIAARRLISWLSNSGMLTEDAEPAAYDRFLAGCQSHINAIAAMTGHGQGSELLTAHIALVMGCLCLSDQEPRLGSALAGLKAELARQILPGGGHVSRHPGVPVDLLLDLLPLKQCFMARQQKTPDWLQETMQRMAAMLRHMQLGDRRLARFNGMAATGVDQLATVLAYHAGPLPLIDATESSGYLRLSRRSTIVLVDGGKLPPAEFSATAHAGTLSFEMSSGPWPVIVNSGAPGPAAQDWRRQARGTAAHSTLLLNDTASARLVREGKEGPEVLTGPSSVEAKIVEPGDGAAEIQGFHTGYQQRFGMVHARVLRLSAQGDRLSGHERIFQPQRTEVAARRDLTYSIHFHIHPQARARYGAEAGTAEIELPGGEQWKFSAYGSKIGLEDSLFFATFSGPIRSVQLVLRGHVLADTQVTWTLERRSTDPVPQLPDSFQS